MESTQSQTQSQPQPTPLEKGFFNTWGGAGQFEKRLLILDSYQVIDPETIPHPITKGIIQRINMDGVELLVENNSSSKNKHIYVYAPKNRVLAVVEIVKTSVSTRAKIICPENMVCDLMERVGDEVSYEEGKTVIRRYLYYTAKINDKEVSVTKMLLNIFREKPYKKPRIYYKESGDLAELKGETYKIRDTLKGMGFRWLPDKKVWVGQSKHLDTLRKIVDLLRE